MASTTRQLEEYKDRVRQKKTDGTIRVELASLKSELQKKDNELEELHIKYNKVKPSNDSGIDGLRADLPVDLREQDCQPEEREDQIDNRGHKGRFRPITT
ncbi:hypothetical protein LTR51_008805, partial [Lithohypha guttulata]